MVDVDSKMVSTVAVETLTMALLDHLKQIRTGKYILTLNKDIF